MDFKIGRKGGICLYKFFLLFVPNHTKLNLHEKNLDYKDIWSKLEM